MQPDDERLVAQCLEGDTESFGQLVSRYENAVYATAFYYVGRHGSAEDVAQEAFFEAYRSLGQLRDPRRFGPWLREVASRTAANWLRKHGRRLNMETPLPFRRTVSIEDAREGPAGTLEHEELYSRVQKAIDTLPERYRLPVVLRYLQELSYQEISEFTGESREEIRGILQRAGGQLRDLLADLSTNEDEGKWLPAQK